MSPGSKQEVRGSAGAGKEMCRSLAVFQLGLLGGMTAKFFGVGETRSRVRGRSGR